MEGLARNNSKRKRRSETCHADWIGTTSRGHGVVRQLRYQRIGFPLRPASYLHGIRANVPFSGPSHCVSGAGGESLLPMGVPGPWKLRAKSVHKSAHHPVSTGELCRVVCLVESRPFVESFGRIGSVKPESHQQFSPPSRRSPNPASHCAAGKPHPTLLKALSQSVNRHSVHLSIVQSQERRRRAVRGNSEILETRP